MSRTFTYGIAPGYGEKNSMAASDTIEVNIPVNKCCIYEDARAILHKFGDSRLTEENGYHINTVQADDLDEDTRLFDRSFMRAYKDAVAACSAYRREDVEYVNDIGLLMPSTWQEELTDTLIDNVHDYILFSIVADFLKITEPREYTFYKEEAAKFRIQIKDVLESRKPFTRYTEIKPF